MVRRRRPGYYDVGRIIPHRDETLRPKQTGTFGVIKGKNIEKNGRLEWQHICEGIIKKSKWVAFRIGPGDNNTGTRTDLLKAFDTKKEAVDWVKRKYGKKFHETY